MKAVGGDTIVGDSEEVMELSSSRRSALAGNASGETSDRMVPVAEAAITAMVRIWASDSRRTATEANDLLSAILGAMLSPRERAELVDAEILRRVG